MNLSLLKLREAFPTEYAAMTVYGLRVCGAFLTFILQVFLARWLGQYEFGIFAFVWATLLVLGELLSFGFYNLIQRLLPEYRENGEAELLRGAIWGSAAIIALTSSLVAALIAAILYLLKAVNFIGEIYYAPLLIALLALPAFALSDYLSGIARSYGWMTRAFSPTALIRPLSIIALGVGAIVLGATGHAVTAMMCAVIAIWVTLFVSLLTIGKKIPANERIGSRRYTPLAWIIAALPMMMISSFELLLFNIDIFMITNSQTPDQTGLYFAATKIMALVAFINFAVGSAFNARFAKFHAEGDQEALNKIIRNSATICFYSSIALLALVIVFRTQLLSLFGQGFEIAEIIIRILAAGLIFRAIVGPGERILMMTGQQNICAAIYVGAALLDIALNLLLIPLLGIIGAAIATSITFFVMATAQLITIKWRLNSLALTKLPHQLDLS